MKVIILDCRSLYKSLTLAMMISHLQVQKQHLMRKTAQQLQQKAAMMPGGRARDRTNSKAGGGKPSVVDPTTASRSQQPGRSNSVKAAATNISSNTKMMTTAAPWEIVSPAPTSAVARNLGMRSIRGKSERKSSIMWLKVINGESCMGNIGNGVGGEHDGHE